MRARETRVKSVNCVLCSKVDEARTVCPPFGGCPSSEIQRAGEASPARCPMGDLERMTLTKRDFPMEKALVKSECTEERLTIELKDVEQREKVSRIPSFPEDLDELRRPALDLE